LASWGGGHAPLGPLNPPMAFTVQLLLNNYFNFTFYDLLVKVKYSITSIVALLQSAVNKDADVKGLSIHRPTPPCCLASRLPSRWTMYGVDTLWSLPLIPEEQDRSDWYRYDICRKKATAGKLVQENFDFYVYKNLKNLQKSRC